MWTPPQGGSRVLEEMEAAQPDLPLGPTVVDVSPSADLFWRSWEYLGLDDWTHANNNRLLHLLCLCFVSFCHVTLNL